MGALVGYVRGTQSPSPSASLIGLSTQFKSLLPSSFPQWRPFLTLLSAMSKVRGTEWTDRVVAAGTEEGGAKEPLHPGWPCVPGTCLSLEYSSVLETSRSGLEPKSLLTRSVARAKPLGVSLLLFPHANPVQILGYYPNLDVTITGYLPLSPSAPIPHQFPHPCRHLTSP